MHHVLVIIITIFIIAIALIHIYWGHGGNWPGKNRQDLINKVFGQGHVFPSIFACYGVATALLIAATLPTLSLYKKDFIPTFPYISWAYYFIALIFFIRGSLSYLQIIERIWVDEFIYLNRRIYNPLCLFIALSFIYFGYI